MALNAATLAQLIKTNLGAAEDQAKQDAFAQAVAQAVVDHIKAAGVVTGMAAVSSGSSAGSWPIVGGAIG